MSWYYVNKAGKTIGPVSITDLKPLYASKEINDKTFIWNGTSVNKWSALKKVPAVHSQLRPPSAGGTFSKLYLGRFRSNSNAPKLTKSNKLSHKSSPALQTLSKTTSHSVASYRGHYHVPPKPKKSKSALSVKKEKSKKNRARINTPSPPSMSKVPKPPAVTPSVSKDQKFFSSVTADDIDVILDEIDANEEEKQHVDTHITAGAPKLKFVDVDEDEDEEKMMELSVPSLGSARSKSANYLPFNNRGIRMGINWNELSILRFQSENTSAIRRIVGNKRIDINTRNPRDGTTLLMHAIIIGDLQLVRDVCKAGADLTVKDKEGDDAIDYALIFQRYRITQLLLMLRKKLNTDLLNRMIEMKEKEASFMKMHTFGKFQHNLIMFVMKAIREREPFDINLMYLAWYFVCNAEDKVTGNNPYPDPLQSPLFKIMMKVYGQIIRAGRRDKKGWKWLKTYFIQCIIWLLPHPDAHYNDVVSYGDVVSTTLRDDRSETSVEDTSRNTLVIEGHEEDISSYAPSIVSSVGMTKLKEIEYTNLVSRTSLNEQNLLAFLFL